MANRRKKAPPRPKKRRWLIPKLLLILVSFALLAFLGAIFIMEQELRRSGIFGSESPPIREPLRPQLAAPSPKAETSKGETPRQKKATVLPADEMTRDERQQLDDILRAKSQ